MSVGKVFVASMNMRGERAQCAPNTTSINVTSAQAKRNVNRLHFSPMTPIEGGYKGFWCFENYWQSGKVFETIPPEISREWWMQLKEPKRRFPKGKGKAVLFAQFEGYDEPMDYVTARKRVYVPEYFNLIKDSVYMKQLKQRLKEGESFTLYDFDGPRLSDKTPICLEITPELLIEKINDVSFPLDILLLRVY